MGLLDILGAGTPQANALGNGLLGMGAGLLQGGAYGALGPALGKGLLGFQQMNRQAQQDQLQQQQVGIMNDYHQSQQQMLQAQLDMLRRNQQLGMSLLGFGAPAGATPQPTGVTSQNGATAYPVNTGSSTPAGAPTAGAGAIPPALRQAVGMDLVFNGGKGISGLIKPNVQNVRPGGTVFDATSGRVQFSAPTSQGTQIVYDANGNPSVAMLPGAIPAATAQSVAKATGPATFKTVTVNNADGSNTLTTARAVGEQIQNQPAPVRNNNPGALMPGGQLAQYQTMDQGLQALDANLARYGNMGINTVAGVISKWAPPNENDTKAYIADVSKRLGIDQNQKIDLSNPLVRQAIGTAIAIHENGVNGVFGAPAQTPQSDQPQQAVQRGIQVQGEGTIAANQTLGKDQANELMASRKAAISATDDLTNLAQERQAIAAGTWGGTGAQAKLNAVKFLQGWLPGLGSLDQSKVSNTDYLVSVLGKGLLTHAKDLGYNPTDADATRIEAIIGTIGKDPQALSNLINYQEMMANRVIQRHNLLVSQAKKGGIQSNFDMSVSPQTGMPGTSDFKMVGGQQAPSSSGFKIIGVR